MDGSRIRNKTVSFSFENGVAWTGSKASSTLRKRYYLKTMTSPQQHHLAVDHSTVSIQDSGQTLSDGFLVDRCDFYFI